VDGTAVQVERLLRAIYMPQNFYCIHIDSKSPTRVHRSAAAVASCFDNVFIASRLESVRELVCLSVCLSVTRDMTRAARALSLSLSLFVKAHVRRNKVKQLYVAQLCCSTKLPRQLDSCLLPRQLPVFHRQTSMDSSYTDDDIVISSALLIASTLCRRRQVNVRKRQ